MTTISHNQKEKKNIEINAMHIIDLHIFYSSVDNIVVLYFNINALITAI